MRPLRDRLLNDHPSMTWMSGGAVLLGAVLFFLLAANDYQLTVGGTVGIDALAAMGLTVVAGRAGQLALGQAGFMAVGAYAAAYGTTHMGISFIVAVIMGVAVASFLGLVVGYVALRLRGNYLAMATLAFGAIIYGLLQVQGKLGGLGGIFGIPPLKLIGTFDTPRSAYLFIWAVVILAFVAVALYLRGRAGRELSALRDDELAAATVGVHNTFRKLQAFTLSAVLGAIAGSILAANSTVIDPSLFQPLISFQIFLMIVIGGLGSLGGSVAGAAIVVWLVQLTPGTGDTAYVVLGALVIVLMAIFPQGLAGVCSWLVDRLRSGGPHVGRPDRGVPQPEEGLDPDAALGAGTGA
jgi:branched-chain amino acid transport system permease protein